MSLQTSEKFLHEIVSTVASSLELEEVLAAVVRLLSDASAVHACFVYLVEDDERLVLRAASPPYERRSGKIALERGEGLAWWAVEHGEPAFIRENAARRPAREVRPGARGGALPVAPRGADRRRGGDVIGVITAHTEAPREFTEDEVEFLVTSASLVAGAIENARLYEETRRRVAELEQLTELAEAIARAEALDELLPTVVARRAPAPRARAPATSTCSTRRARSSTCARATRSRGARGRRSGSPSSAPSSRAAAAARASPSRSSRTTSCSACSSPRAARASTSRARSRTRPRSAIKKIAADRAAHREEPDQGLLRAARRRAARAATSRAAPRASAATSTSRTSCSSRSRRATRSSARCAARRPGSLFDRRDDSIRALLRVRPPSSEAVLSSGSAASTASSASRSSIGVSNVCQGGPRFADGFEEARHALLGTVVLAGTPAVMAYEELGAYKYLLRVASTAASATRTVDARREARRVRPQRGAQLLATLEEFLRRHGLDQRDRRGALRPPEHAAPAAAPHRRALRPRPPHGRLARWSRSR